MAMVLKMQSDYSFPSVYDFLKWKYPNQFNAHCLKLVSGRLLHSLIAQATKENTLFNAEHTYRYLKQKCPQSDEEKIQRWVARAQILFYRFYEIYGKKIFGDAATLKLIRVGNAFLFVKPDLKSNNAVYRIKFSRISMPLPSHFQDECIVYSMAYPLYNVYLVSISINSARVIRFETTVNQKLQIQTEIEEFYKR